jgi:hypothetical protein
MQGGHREQESDMGRTSQRNSQRNTGAFILGGIIGGIVGAAVTLWNTPKSGDELRATVSGGSSTGATATRDGAVTTRSTTSGRFSNPVLSFIERAAAPIVGVELGKLAKDDPGSTEHRPVRTSAADARPPVHGDEHVPHDKDNVDHQQVATTDELTSPPSRSAANVKATATSDLNDGDAQVSSHGDDHVSHDEIDVDDQHVATIEELTSPPPQAADGDTREDRSRRNREPSPFPDLEHNDRT